MFTVTTYYIHCMASTDQLCAAQFCAAVRYYTYYHNDNWRAERAYLVVQLAQFFHLYVSDDAFWPRDYAHATHKHNRPCLFRSPSMRSI